MIDATVNLSSPMARLCGGMVGALVFGLPVLAWLRTGEVLFTMRPVGAVVADRTSDLQQFWSVVGVFSVLSLACVAVAALGLNGLHKGTARCL